MTAAGVRYRVRLNHQGGRNGVTYTRAMFELIDDLAVTDSYSPVPYAYGDICEECFIKNGFHAIHGELQCKVDRLVDDEGMSYLEAWKYVMGYPDPESECEIVEGPLCVRQR